MLKKGDIVLIGILDPADYFDPNVVKAYNGQPGKVSDVHPAIKARDALVTVEFKDGANIDFAFQDVILL